MAEAFGGPPPTELATGAAAAGVHRGAAGPLGRAGPPGRRRGQLPADPEFRAALTSYLDWTSRAG